MSQKTICDYCGEMIEITNGAPWHMVQVTQVRMVGEDRIADTTAMRDYHLNHLPNEVKTLMISGEYPMAVSFLDGDVAPQVVALVAASTLSWPHTTDPSDPGTAERVTIDPGGGLALVHLDVPASPMVLELPYVLPGTQTVTCYASTDAADPLGSVIEETVLVRNVTPGSLPGPETPSRPRVFPLATDRPHFAWPFERGENGKARLVDQDSREHITGQEYAVVVTPLGWRTERPEFGWPWPEFSMVPLDLEPLRMALKRFVPDSNADITEWASTASQAIRHVQIIDQDPDETDQDCLMAFIRVPFVIDPAALADAAVLELQARWLGWMPHDGDMEVIQIEALAPMASDGAQVAATVPDAIFRQYGLVMFGLPYNQGTPARGQATIWAIDDSGYDSGDELVEFALESMAFTTDTPVVIPGGQTAVVVPITCSSYGLVGNDLMGSGNQISSFPWVESIIVEPETTGGSNPETDLDYQDRLRSRLLKLQATTLVNGHDFELMALSIPGIGRAMAIVGQDRVVTVAVTDDEGEIVPQAIKDELDALYDDYRQVNTQYSIVDPTYTEIDVSFEIETLPNYIESEVLNSAIQSVQQWLAGEWGAPLGMNTDADNTTWLQSTVVRISEGIRVASVGGVRWVQNFRINGATADVNLPGTAPLTRPGTVTGIVI